MSENTTPSVPVLNNISVTCPHCQALFQMGFGIGVYPVEVVTAQVGEPIPPTPTPVAPTKKPRARKVKQ